MTRKFAPAAALAGLAWIAWGAFEASSTAVYGDDFESALDYANMGLFDIALLFTTLVMLGVVAEHGETLGRTARVSARIVAAGAISLATFATLDAAYPDTALLEGVATGAMIAFWLGGTFFALAVARARLFGRWIGPAFVASMVPFAPLSEVGGSILLGAVLLAVWAHERVPDRPALGVTGRV